MLICTEFSMAIFGKKEDCILNVLILLVSLTNIEAFLIITL